MPAVPAFRPMNVSRGKISHLEAGPGMATTTYKDAKNLVVVSGTNKGDCPVVLTMWNLKGKVITTYAFKPSHKAKRVAKGVMSVDLSWTGPNNCDFEYEITASP